MKTIKERITTLKDWTSKYKNIKDYKNEDEFVDFCIELANYIREISIIAINTIPYNRKKDFKCYNLLEATIVGNIVRIYKLYDMINFNVAEGYAEIVAILTRLLIEAGGYFEYLINSGDNSKKNYILISHKANSIQLRDLKKKSEKRELKPIEQRMNERIIRLLEEDGLTKDDIINNKKWKLDGKSIEQIIKKKDSYDYGYRSSCIHVHGLWHDLSIYHLDKIEGGYMPRLEYYSPDIRYLNPLSILFIDYIIKFLQWNNGDPDNILNEILLDFRDIALSLYRKHEIFWDKNYREWKKKIKNE